MNIVIMMGRLTRDPEVRYSQDGKAFATFSLAVDKRFKREGQADADFFHNCKAFGKTAEFVEKYVHKGTKVVIQGRLQNDNYQAKDGNTVYRDSIMIDSIEFAESKATAQAPYMGQPNNQGGQQSNNQGRSRQSQARQDDFMNIPDGIDEELPFN